MRWFVRRLTAIIVMAFVAMAVAVIARPGISSAQCDPNMSWNSTTRECKPPPPVPDWYTPPPPYAPSFAGQNVPPPPPPPPSPSWAPQVPMWSVGFQQWGYYAGNVWVPL
ncbi:hypothetical protein [Mycobacterium sp. 852002-40037_SCH5390672]|uniref:hypothetical protein n=1 Tax=Mycobacterium sp. 852002-40037_SCH5390672 TaxID=1834089 RepID=UPI0009EF2550|nr:hypothetical protein [Mycobacterium sp. 852002-40037_SCH5390672]